ncbi:MAG TPA: urease accessory UreF family protein [Gaiellaceae bacterium]|jgi:urease accessory protein|nr:urease accessory UreF family protein [Gaiellaceae bacterium]
MRGEALFSVLQLSDSGFPTGRYTLSHGLEAFAYEGLLETPCAPDALAELLRDCIRFGVGRSDGVALACAHRAVDAEGGIDAERVVRIDRRLSAVKLAREGREASTRTGRALLAAAPAVAGVRMSGYVDLVDRGEAPGNHAVVVGLLSALLEVPRYEAVAGELFAYSTGWVAAAVRLGLTDHLTAQSVLRRVHPVLAEAARRAVVGEVDDIAGCTPLPDLMSMRHEQAELRLFAS